MNEATIRPWATYALMAGLLFAARKNGAAECQIINMLGLAATGSVGGHA